MLNLILGVTTQLPAKHTHRRQRLFFEVDLAISVAEYDQAIAELTEQRQSLEDLQQVFGAYRLSKTPSEHKTAAQATCEALVADVALLIEAKDRSLLDPRTVVHVHGGIKRKCTTAIANLQLIAAEMNDAA